MSETSNEELFCSLYEYLVEEYGFRDDIAKMIALVIPTTIDELYTIPTIGTTFLKEKGEQLIKYISAFIHDNGLIGNTLSEAFDLFFKKGSKNIKDYNYEKIHDYILAVNADLPFEYKLNTKQLLVYLAKQGLIKMDYGVTTEVTSYGKQYDIEPIQYHNGIGILLGKKILKYLNDNLYYLYAYSYGRGPFSYLYEDVDEILSERKPPKKHFFIFDLDQTIVDTDFYRVDRRMHKEIEIGSIPYIDGFFKLFLTKGSKFALYKNEAIIVTNSPQKYAERIIGNGFLKNIPLYCVYSKGNYNDKVLFIEKYLKKNKILKEDVIAFGDDEKDALTYSICGIPYYIVSNQYGYDSYNELLKKIVYPKDTDFRNNFLYDIIQVESSEYTNLESRYFDDIVVYYRRYYDKKNYVEDYNSPEFDGRKHLSKLTYARFGSNKSFYLQCNVKSFVNEDYKDLTMQDNTIFCKVPGSSELKYDSLAPCSILINKLCGKYGIQRNYSNLLLRKKVSSTAHGGGGSRQNSSYHYQNIEVTRTITGKEVYLFDDISTTGSQMMACVELLYEAGASHVVCFALAKTCPSPRYPIIDIHNERRY